MWVNAIILLSSYILYTAGNNSPFVLAQNSLSSFSSTGSLSTPNVLGPSVQNLPGIPSSASDATFDFFSFFFARSNASNVSKKAPEAKENSSIGVFIEPGKTPSGSYESESRVSRMHVSPTPSKSSLASFQVTPSRTSSELAVSLPRLGYKGMIDPTDDPRTNLYKASLSLQVLALNKSKGNEEAVHVETSSRPFGSEIQAFKSSFSLMSSKTFLSSFGITTSKTSESLFPQQGYSGVIAPSVKARTNPDRASLLPQIPALSKPKANNETKSVKNLSSTFENESQVFKEHIPSTTSKTTLPYSEVTLSEPFSESLMSLPRQGCENATGPLASLSPKVIALNKSKADVDAKLGKNLSDAFESKSQIFKVHISSSFSKPTLPSLGVTPSKPFAGMTTSLPRQGFKGVTVPLAEVRTNPDNSSLSTQFLALNNSKANDEAQENEGEGSYFSLSLLITPLCFIALFFAAWIYESHRRPHGAMGYHVLQPGQDPKDSDGFNNSAFVFYF